jgi:hypothetical protein
MRFVLLSFAALLTVACGGGQADSSVASDDVTSATEFRLEGFNETILVGSSDGKLTVFHLGSTTTKNEIGAPRPRPPEAMRAQGGRFHLLYDDGSYVIVDPDRGEIEKTIQLPAVTTSPGDFEFATESAVYVSLKKTAKVIRVDLGSGAELSSVDLGALRIEDGSVEPRSLLKVGDQLFVQAARAKATRRAEQGAIAVIDTTQDSVKKVIELAGVDPRTNETISGLGPDLPMVHDTRRNHIFVSATGNRPSNTGLIARIDPATLTVRDVKKAESGFQGAVVSRAPFDELFIIYHTSTPTTSTHLFSEHVRDDGTLESERPGALLDAFDGMDALAINTSGTLVAMANTCITGFCVNGAGVAFVDARTRTILPKLKSDTIGFAPVFVLFK